MSSFDSAFNSLGAATARDFVEPRLRRSVTLFESRTLTVAWGLLCTSAGMAFAGSRATVIELVNQVGSLFYGPVLGVFALALYSRRATNASAIAALLAGLAVNALVWRRWPDVPWLWWNAIGFGVAWFVGTAVGRARRRDLAATSTAGADVLVLGAAALLWPLLCVVFEHAAD